MIVDFTGRPIEQEPEVNQLLVDELEKFLDLAKKGEIVAGSYAFVYDNETCSEGWVIRTHGDIMQLMAQAKITEYKFARIIITEEEADLPQDDPA